MWCGAAAGLCSRHVAFVVGMWHLFVLLTGCERWKGSVNRGTRDKTETIKKKDTKNKKEVHEERRN